MPQCGYSKKIRIKTNDNYEHELQEFVAQCGYSKKIRIKTVNPVELQCVEYPQCGYSKKIRIKTISVCCQSAKKLFPNVVIPRK